MIYSFRKGGILMKKSNTLIKSILSIGLVVVMLMTSFVGAFARTVDDEDEKLQYLYTFNYGVNSIKEKKPSFKYVKNSGISTADEDDIELNLKTAGDLSDDARKYLSILVDAFFNPERGILNNFIATLTETDNSYTEKLVSKGLDTTNLLPVQGESYVSALSAEDDYTLRVEEINDLLDPTNNRQIIRFSFDEYDLESVKGSPLEKVFDLPSGAINPVLIGGTSYDPENDPLDDIKFADFKFFDAYVQANFNSKGELERYIQNISYRFSFSFYDLMRMFDAYTNIDLMEIGIAIANAVLVNTGNPEITAREALQKTEVVIRYDIKTELDSFDWNPRYFGDIDNDGDVDAYDARTALRYSVSLEEIEDQESLIYGDVNFDGVINASDARTILRTSVNIEKAFSEIPEGETVKIVVINPPVEVPPVPDDGENPDDNEEPDVPDDTEPPAGGEDEGIKLPTTGDVADGVSDFINAIFTVINAAKGEGTFNDDSLASLIQNIKDIVNGKGNGNDVPPDEIIDAVG